MNEILEGDALVRLKELPDESVDCCITSPPYWNLRDYNVAGQLGLEPTFDEYIEKLCVIFNEVRRVLRKTGSCFVNLGDTYSGNKDGKTDAKVSDYLKNTSTAIHKRSTITEKSLCQIPARFALAMSERGWILRNKIIWHKPNAMPSSADDRFTIDFEEIFFFTKEKRYYFAPLRQPHSDVSLARIEKPWHGKLTDGHALGGLKDGNMSQMCHPDGRNMRTVWSINTGSNPDEHFAVFPEELVARIISSGCPPHGIVLDPFMGSGTTGAVAKKLGCQWIGIELNPEYIKMAEARIRKIGEPLFSHDH